MLGGQLGGSGSLAFTVCVSQPFARSLSKERLPLCENGHTVTMTSIPRPSISRTMALGSGQY